MFGRKILVRLFPRVAAAHLSAFSARAPALFARYGIAGQPARLAMFLAQIGHESAGLTALEERLSYTPARLMQVWPARFPSLATAAAVSGEPERLANLVYAGRMGNGPAESGDGWRYRGRGYIQLTGRANYRAVGALCGLDLEAQPDRVAAPGDALAVACGFWTRARLNEPSDSGDLATVTRRINGGQVGLVERARWLARVRAILDADESGGAASPSRNGEVTAR